GYIRQGDRLERTFVAIPARLATHLCFDFTIPILARDFDVHIHMQQGSDAPLGSCSR
ncbi:hypothetical protein M422DRAFT_38480, partial [Sphaerobolus stellatus SS14]